MIAWRRWSRAMATMTRASRCALAPSPLGTSPSPCDAVVFGDESAVAARLWPR